MSKFFLYLQKEARRKCLSITAFRESICETLISSKSSTPSTTKNGHYLKKTDERQSGKRSDRRRRKICVGCYEYLFVTKKMGRDIARRRSKKVITTCNGCPGNPGYCLECFQRKHKSASSTVCYILITPEPT